MWPKLWDPEDVPTWLGENESTTPHVFSSVVGPSHAQLRALAAGESPPLALTDRYRVEGRIGHGGMATVYAGRLLSPDRPVAIKILDEVVGHDNGDQLARFIAEVRITSSLRHPNIVDVLDFGSTQDGVVFMVMELLEGEDLQTLIRRAGPQSWPRTRAIMRDICAALVVVHRAGLVHRDLKAANCFLTPDHTKLIDFGIAIHANAGRRPGLPADSVSEVGVVLGTPEYMSPEQAQGQAVDARSDIYTAGILLGELLTGRRGQGALADILMAASQFHKPTRSMAELAGEGVEINPGIAAIYARALQKRPEDRFATIEAFAAAIERVTIADSLDASRPRREA